ncbi:MAG: tetratricopeptide repeat protein [Alkalispirochaetaceae bacterium]
MTYDEAIYALSKHKFTPAIAVFLGHLAYNPEDGEAWMHLGIAYTEAGFQQEALEALHRAEIYSEESAELCEALGCAYLRLDEVKLARHYLEDALLLPECPASAFRNLGVLLLQLGETKSAEALIEIALYGNPDDAQTLYAHVLLLEEKARRGDDAARSRLSEALEDILRRPAAPPAIRSGASRRLAALNR